MLFNGEISTVTYFKDITFGILYEQIKAQNQLQTMLTSTFKHKIGTPLNTIIQSLEVMEGS